MNIIKIATVVALLCIVQITYPLFYRVEAWIHPNGSVLIIFCDAHVDEVTQKLTKEQQQSVLDIAKKYGFVGLFEDKRYYVGNDPLILEYMQGLKCSLDTTDLQEYGMSYACGFVTPLLGLTELFHKAGLSATSVEFRFWNSKSTSTTFARVANVLDAGITKAQTYTSRSDAMNKWYQNISGVLMKELNKVKSAIEDHNMPCSSLNDEHSAELDLIATYLLEINFFYALEKQQQEQQNIILAAGCAHVERMQQGLTQLGYKKIAEEGLQTIYFRTDMHASAEGEDFASRALEAAKQINLHDFINNIMHQKEKIIKGLVSQSVPNVVQEKNGQEQLLEEATKGYASTGTFGNVPSEFLSTEWKSTYHELVNLVKKGDARELEMFFNKKDTIKPILNVRQSFGSFDTPLLQAIGHSKHDLVELFLQLGASPDVLGGTMYAPKNSKLWQSPVMVATEMDDKAMIELLDKYQKRSHL